MNDSFFYVLRFDPFSKDNKIIPFQRQNAAGHPHLDPSVSSPPAYIDRLLDHNS